MSRRYFASVIRRIPLAKGCNGADIGPVSEWLTANNHPLRTRDSLGNSRNNQYDPNGNFVSVSVTATVLKRQLSTQYNDYGRKQ